MANNESQKLAVDVIARINQLEKSMAKAGQVVDRSTGGMERRLKRFESSAGASFAKVGNLAKASLAGLFAGVAAGGVGGLVAGFASATKAVAELGDAAKTAGVSSKAFQEWRYVAEQARIPIDAMTDGLKEMSIRASEFAQTGKGSAAAAFQSLGLTPQEVKERLKDPSEFLLLLIDRTKQLNDTARGVQLFDELFGGTGGERMVSLLSQGEKGIRAQIKAANDLGIVIDDDLIKRAAELDAKFNTIVHTVGQNLKAAIVSASDSLVDFIDRWRATENQMAGTLSSRQAEVDSKRLDLENKILETTNNQLLTQQQRNKAVGQYRIELQKLTEESGAIAGALGTKLPEVSKTTDRTFTPITPPDPKTESARAKATREAERERQAVTDLIAQLDFEYSLIGKSAAQQDKMNALRQAGAAATTEEQLAIASKVDAINRESEAYEKTKAAAEEARDAARDFAGTLVDGFIEGASAAEVLGNALKNLASRLLNSGLDSLFSGGGILGGLFGGGGGFPSAPGGLYSDGGYTGDGGKYQPAGVVHKGEYVFDQAAVKAAGGPAAMEAMRRNLKGYANGGAVGVSVPSVPSLKSLGGNGQAPVSVSYAPVIDARGADAEAVARLEKVVAKQAAELQGRIEAGVRSAQKRNVKLG
ncbi:hypothetical protein O9X80_06310 [Agrobacterium salinitolerans]|uniref:hypothetical protein n=1 Tax=Agrobacterium salinitolerans TaxID=1183413 RepID=UPI0022B83A36|nr:hypothetical protein [Agrobacterium salinitolerans]MCZ7974105.1 hypothetical protein [Agrobacterium salinitolerans]